MSEREREKKGKKWDRIKNLIQKYILTYNTKQATECEFNISKSVMEIETVRLAELKRDNEKGAY